MSSEEPAFLRDALKGIPLVRTEPIPDGATFPKVEPDGASISPMSERRVFTHSVIYRSGGSWWARVVADGSAAPYWQDPRITRRGAQFAAWRRARKLNRLEKRGMVK